ncbi:MAG: DMT family transporter [Lachnospiraceae bacterium]
MSKLQIRNSFILLLTAVIWGVSFVAQSVGMEYVGPFTFNCTRFLIGGIFLIPCIGILQKISPPKAAEKKIDSQNKKILWTGGILCGTILCLASNFQQIGIESTTVGKAGFITAFYIVIVPVLGLFLKKKCPPAVWAGVGLALAGLYFLCIQEGVSIGKGDILIFVGALLFSIHILVISHFTELVDGVKMSCIQFLVSGSLSGIVMFLFESPHISSILAAWQPIVYAGIFSCGIAYTLQVVGQKGMNPTVVSLILSLEAVISVLAGMILLNQHLNKREIAGCVLMFVAIILAQLPQRRKVKDSERMEKAMESITTCDVASDHECEPYRVSE